jgi:WD40 repeat protein
VATATLRLTLRHPQRANAAPETVRAVAFSPDGRWLATGGTDTTAWVWEAATGERLFQALPHPGWVRGVVVTTDEGGVLRVLTASGNQARLWAPARGEAPTAVLEHRGEVWRLAFRRDGKVAFTGNDLGMDEGEVHLWDVAAGKPLGAALPHPAPVRALALRPDEQALFTGSWARTAEGWTVRTREIDLSATREEVVAGGPLRRVVREDAAVNGVAFSPDGQTFLTGSGDRIAGKGRAQLWETATGNRVGPPREHDATVLSVAFSPDGLTFLTGSMDQGARLWPRDAAQPALRVGHLAWVGVTSFSPDGRTFLTASEDNTTRVWNTTTGECLGTFALPRATPVYAAAWRPDGRMIVAGGLRGVVRLWDVETRKVIGRAFEHQDSISALAFSPDGTTVVTGSADRTARLWDVASCQPVGHILVHDGPVLAVAFSPDGRAVATGSRKREGDGGEVRLWAAGAGRPLGPPLSCEAAVHAVAFSPDGRLLLTGGADGKARLWTVATPVTADAERIRLWVEVASGMELDTNEAARVLDTEAWQERRRRLEERGGAPDL